MPASVQIDQARSKRSAFITLVQAATKSFTNFSFASARRVDLGEGAQLRVRAEDQVDARAGPLDRLRLAVAALVQRSSPAGCHSVPMSSRLTKKSFVSVPGLLGEDAMLRAAGVRAEHAQAADQHRHLRRRQPQQLRPVHQRLFGLHELHLLAADVVAEAVGARLERREGLDVGLLLRRVHAARREGHLHVDAGILRRLLDRRIAAEHDQVGERDLLAALAFR